MFERFFLPFTSAKNSGTKFSPDIHSHIIPGIDDGAESLKEALMMARQFVELGNGHIFATPRVKWRRYPNTPYQIRSAAEDLQDALDKARIPLKIEAAAEYHLDEDFLEMLRTGQELLTLPGNRLLVDMPPACSLSTSEEALYAILKSGRTPVLAHPERYLCFHADPEIYRRLHSQGCELQLNILSMIRYYGRRVQKMAGWLLKENLFTYVGSEAREYKHLLLAEQGFRVAAVRRYEFRNSMTITSKLFDYLPSTT